MTKEEALAELQRIADDQEDRGMIEEDHIKADDILVKLIDDADVARMYDAIRKWYA